jgi:hypothetical protein
MDELKQTRRRLSDRRTGKNEDDDEHKKVFSAGLSPVSSLKKENAPGTSSTSKASKDEKYAEMHKRRIFGQLFYMSKPGRHALHYDYDSGTWNVALPGKQRLRLQALLDSSIDLFLSVQHSCFIMEKIEHISVFF